MKWFTSSSSAASALDEPRLLKMEKLETSSVVAAAANASHRAGGDNDDDDDDEDGDYGPTSLAPSFTKPFDLEAEATSGSRSLDFCDMSTLESRARRGIRGKRNVLGGGRSDRGEAKDAKSTRKRSRARCKETDRPRLFEKLPRYLSPEPSNVNAMPMPMPMPVITHPSPSPRWVSALLFG